MTATDTRKILRRLKTRQKELATLRGVLREIESDLSDLVESTDRAYEALEECTAALSEYL